MNKPTPFHPMEYIEHAIKMFMEEEPIDALRVLQNAQQHRFEWMEYQKVVDAIEDEETVDSVTWELVSKILRRGGYVPNPEMKANLGDMLNPEMEAPR